LWLCCSSLWQVGMKRKKRCNYVCCSYPW
jgi:hypothetical protein